MNLSQDQIRQVNSNNGRYYEVDIDCTICGGVDQTPLCPRCANTKINTINCISVTRVLDVMLSKPALVPWAYNIGIEETFNVFQGIAKELSAEDDSVQEKAFIAAICEGEPSKLKQHLKDKERTYDNKRVEAANRGTLIHLAFEAICSSDRDPRKISGMPEFYEVVESYLIEIEKFIDDYKPEFLESEMKVASITGQYAGTLDTVCRIGAHPKNRRHKDMTGKTVVLDLKTNKDGKIYPDSHFLQVTAYERAYEEMGGEIDGGMVLAVGPESFSVGVNYLLPDSFSRVLDAYNIIEESKRNNPNARKK